MTENKNTNRMYSQTIYLEPLLLFGYSLADTPGKTFHYKPYES